MSALMLSLRRAERDLVKKGPASTERGCGRCDGRSTELGRESAGTGDNTSFWQTTVGMASLD